MSVRGVRPDIVFDQSQLHRVVDVLIGMRVFEVEYRFGVNQQIPHWRFTLFNLSRRRRVLGEGWSVSLCVFQPLLVMVEGSQGNDEEVKFQRKQVGAPPEASTNRSFPSCNTTGLPKGAIPPTEPPDKDSTCN
jgi:hypothetical protein